MIKDISRDDMFGLMVILFLYVLQGVPLGLTFCVPMVLQDAGIGYSDQAIFSLAIWPFSLKLLWAAVVDGVHIRRIGQRKTWIVVAQATVALVLCGISFAFDNLLLTKNIVAITACFTLLTFMVTVQDISVDGWALTLISEKMVGSASNMQTIGQTIGSLSWNLYFSVVDERIGYAKYIRYWSIVYFISTVVILVLVKEKKDNRIKSSLANVGKSYKNLFRLFTLRSIQWWVLVCLTCKMGFAPHGEALMLKLRDRCVQKKMFSNISVMMKPISILINTLLIKFTVNKPLTTFLVAYPLYQLTACGSIFLVQNAEQLVANDTIFIWDVLDSSLDIIKSCTASAFYLSASGFHYTIADPLMGGVYMTLLNSVFNMGGVWVETVSLKFLGSIDDDMVKNKTYCDKYDDDFEADGQYQYTDWDSYYYLAIGALVVGTIWYFLFFKLIRRIANMPIDYWRLDENKQEHLKSNDEEDKLKPSEEINIVNNTN